MMMGVCEALGVRMVYSSETDEQRQKREKNEQQRYGDTYRMNPRFFEIVDDQFANWQRIMETPYSGCKVILPVGGWRWGGVTHQPSKVVMMWRDPEEIRQSQEASYAQARAQVDDYNPDTVLAYFRSALVAAEMRLDTAVEKGQLLAWLKVNYRDALDNPAGVAQQVADFIEAPNTAAAAIATIDPSRARFKAEALEKGI